MEWCETCLSFGGVLSHAANQRDSLIGGCSLPSFLSYVDSHSPRYFMHATPIRPPPSFTSVSKSPTITDRHASPVTRFSVAGPVNLKSSRGQCTIHPSSPPCTVSRSTFSPCLVFIHKSSCVKALLIHRRQYPSRLPSDKCGKLYDDLDTAAFSHTRLDHIFSEHRPPWLIQPNMAMPSNLTSICILSMLHICGSMQF